MEHKTSKSSQTKQPIDHLSEKYLNAVSSNDCTGLIPANPKSKEAMSAYKEIYNYEVPVAEDSDKTNQFPSHSNEKNQF
jgi:hypothetical protein